MKEYKAYKFLIKAWKRSGLVLSQFMEMYANMIRYFSIDQLYFDGVLLYKAITPWEREPYTGILQMLSETARHRYLVGVSQHVETIGTVYESYDCLNVVHKYDYKTIWKEFIQSMG